MKLIFSRLALCISFLILCACSHSPSSRSEGEHTDETAEIGDEYLFKFNCVILDASFKKLLRVPGLACILSDSNLVLASAHSVHSLNTDKKLNWSLKNYYIHHTFKNSKFSQNMHGLNLYYKQDPKSGLLKRIDEFLVVSSSGRILKRTNSDKIFKALNVRTEPAPNNWTIDKERGKSVEHSHFNSFNETFNLVEGKKIHTGYVAYCTVSKRIYFLDTELKPLRSIKTDQRNIHGVQQWKEDELIMYVNYQQGENKPKTPQIETYDLKTGEFKLLHKNENIKEEFPACGSIQVINPDKILIFYSLCKPPSDGVSKNAYIELVQLDTKKSQLIPLKNFYYSYVELIPKADYDKFKVYSF